MGARRLAGAVAMAAALVAFAPAAQGRTIGSTQQPAGASPSPCPPDPAGVIYQGTGASPSWTAPNGGSLVSWSTNVTGATPGATVSLVVLRQAGASLTIAAVAAGTVPATPPAGNVAVFTPAAPIRLRPGDKLGLAAPSGGATCFWHGGAVPADQTLNGGPATPGVSPGATISPMPGSPPGYQLNLAAEVVESLDLRLAATAGPANAVAGSLAQLSARVTNTGPASAPVTVTGSLPAGLKVEAAVAAGGSCTVAGQAVTCTIPALTAGASAPVVVLVTPTAAGAFAGTFAAAAPGFPDPTPGDNTATATLTVAPTPSGAAPAAKCIVPALARTPLRVARKLLRQLSCKPGKVTKKRSTRIPKGAVIATKPGRGEYDAGRTVRLVVSSGKKAARKGGARRG